MSGYDWQSRGAPGGDVAPSPMAGLDVRVGRLVRRLRHHPRPADGFPGSGAGAAPDGAPAREGVRQIGRDHRRAQRGYTATMIQSVRHTTRSADGIWLLIGTPIVVALFSLTLGIGLAILAVVIATIAIK